MSARSSTARSSLAAFAAACAIVALTCAGAHAAKRRDVHGLPLPGGTRSISENLFESGQGFRKTVDYYERLLKKRGLAHEAIPVYGYRGVVVARFLAKERGSKWRALHIFRAEGRTKIFIVPSDPLDGSARPR
jgi:hypothetical protein